MVKHRLVQIGQKYVPTEYFGQILTGIRLMHKPSLVQPTSGELFFLISQEVFMWSLCKRQFPHKSVSFSCTVTHIKNQLTDLCGYSLLQNDLKNTLFEISFQPLPSEKETL